MTPQQNSIMKVAVNFGAVVLAVWVADLSMTTYKGWRIKQAERVTGGGAPPSATPPAK